MADASQQGVEYVTEEVIESEEVVGEDVMTRTHQEVIDGLDGDSEILVIEQENGEILIIQKAGDGENEDMGSTEEILQKAGYGTVISSAEAGTEEETLHTSTSVIGNEMLMSTVKKSKKPIMLKSITHTSQQAMNSKVFDTF